MKMAVLKVLEVLSSSTKSWEEAAQNAVADAAKSLRGIKSVNVKNFSAVVKDGKISEYRLNSKITFEVE